jgi:iron(III) transport system ATP-binding protein
VLAHVPSHHDHQIGEWIGIRPEVDHVVTFPRDSGPAATPAPPAVAIDRRVARPAPVHVS